MAQPKEIAMNAAKALADKKGLGIQLLDHVIVNYRGETYSFCDAGLI